jgi:hypothetical protein
MIGSLFVLVVSAVPSVRSTGPVVRVRDDDVRTVRSKPVPAPSSSAIASSVCSIRFLTGYGDPAPGGGVLQTIAHANPGTRSGLTGSAFFSDVGGTDRNQGIFLFDDQGMRAIAIGCGGGGGSGVPGNGTGDPTPIGGTFSGMFGGTVFAPATNANGDVLFMSDVDGGSSPRGLFLYVASTQTISKIAAVGDPAPGGGTLAEVGPGSMNDARTIVFAARGSSAPDDILLEWQNGTLSRFAAIGDPAPSSGIYAFLVTESFGFADGTTIHIGPLPDVNNVEQVAFRAITDQGARGIVVRTNGVDTWYVLAGDPTPHGGTFFDLQGACLTDAGEIAFFADWRPTPSTFNSGWFAGKPGAFRSGLSFFDPVSTGQCFGLAFSRNPMQALDETGDLVQWITIDYGGGVQKEAIVVVAPDGSVTIAAQQGDPTPDGGAYSTYDAWPSLVGLRGAFGAATPGSGHLNSYFQFEECAPAPVAYCRAKRNSLGCTPSIGFTGASSATHASGFTVMASPVLNQKLGLWIYSLVGRDSLPFAGGLLCVAQPFSRAPSASTGGNPLPNDCSGAGSIDMNAFAAGALGGSPSPALGEPGRTVRLQFVSRDPGFAPPDNLSLTGGLEYVVGP